MRVEEEANTHRERGGGKAGGKKERERVGKDRDKTECKDLASGLALVCRRKEKMKI